MRMANERGRLKSWMGCFSIVLAIFAWTSCGVEDGGTWQPTPNIPDDPPTETSGNHAGTFYPMLPEEEAPLIPIADEVGMIACAIPPAPVIDMGGADAATFSKNGDFVCLDDEWALSGLSFCQAMMAFEQRAAAIAKCFNNALAELNRQGSRILGHDWVAAAMPMLPAVWSMTPTEIDNLPGNVSSTIIQLMTGMNLMEAPGDPFCFARAPHVSVEDTKGQALEEIRIDLEETTALLSHIHSAISRGVDLKVTKDLHLELRVKLLKVQNKVESVNACTFRARY
jgi:hypothetical protein